MSTSSGDPNETDESSLYQFHEIIEIKDELDWDEDGNRLSETCVKHATVELDQPSTSKTADYPLLVVSEPNVEYNPKLNTFENKKPSTSTIKVPKPLQSFVEHKIRKRSICLPSKKPQSKKICVKKTPRKPKIGIDTRKKPETVTSIQTNPSTSEEVKPIAFVDIKEIKQEPFNEVQPQERKISMKLKCLKCQIYFNDLNELHSHMKSLHSFDLPCTQCDAILNTREHLLDHLMTVHHTCVTCQLRFLSRKSFANHHLEHDSGRVYVYKCTSCTDTAMSFSSIQRHIQMNHRQSLLQRDIIVANCRKWVPLLKLFDFDDLEQTNTIQCYYCLLLFKPEQIQLHYRFSHFIINCENCNALISLSQVMPDTFEVLYARCKYCDFNIQIGKNDCKLLNVDRKKLKYFEDIETHECKFCFKYFTNITERNKHELDCPCDHDKHASQFEFSTGINIVIPDMFSCDLPCIFCNQYIVYSKLAMHLMMNHNYCGICDESFGTLVEFNEHRKSHERHEITHTICNVCFVGFPHKKMHSHYESFHPYALVREKYLKRVVVEIPDIDTDALDMITCAFCYGIFRKSCDFEEHLRRRHHIYCCIKCKYFALQREESILPDTVSSKLCTSENISCENNSEKSTLTDTHDIKVEVVEETASECDTTQIADQSTPTTMIAHDLNEYGIKNEIIDEIEYDRPEFVSVTQMNLQIVDESNTELSEQAETCSEPVETSSVKIVNVDGVEIKKSTFITISTRPKNDSTSETKKYSFVDVNELILDTCHSAVLPKNVTEHKCLKCILSFNNHKKLIEHMTANHSLELPCTHCDIVVNKREAMFEHLTNVHHICIACRLQFPDQETFLEHHNEHENGRVYLYRCWQCGWIVTSLSSIQRHIQTAHRRLTLHTDGIIKTCRKDVTSLEIYSNEELEQMKMKQCDYCLKLLKPDKTVIHYKYFHFLVRCENCYGFINLPKYFKNGIKLTCDYCEFKFYISDMQCKYLFRQGKGLQKFENIKTYECRYCFRYFSTPSLKNLHETQCPCDHKNHETEIQCLSKTKSGFINETEEIFSYLVPCLFCREYVVYEKLPGHLMEVHKYCGVCDETFATSVQFEEHRNLHQTNQIQHLTCNRCFINYSPKKMVTHLHEFHSISMSKKTKYKSVTVHIPEFKWSIGQSIPCAICYGNFKALCDFEEHLRRRHGISACVECKHFILQEDCDF